MSKLSDYLESGYLVLFFGCLFQSLAGVVYVWGNVSIYAVSYLRLHYEPHLLLSDVFLGIPLQVLTFGILMPFSSTIARSLTPRWAMGLGGLSIVTGFVIMSVSHNYLLTMLSFSLSIGVGGGVSFMAPVIASWAYFPHRKGMASGVVIAGPGVGGFVYSIVATKLINPDNLSGDIQVADGVNTVNLFSEEVADRFPFGCAILCVIFASVTLLTMIFVRMPRVPQQFEASSQQRLLNNSAEVADDHANDEELSLREAVSTKTFWYLFCSVYGTIFYGIFLASAYKNYAQQYIKDDTFLALVGGFGFFFNALARVVFSTSQDRFGFKPVYLALIIIQTVICATVQFTVESKPLFFITVALSIACEGGHFTIFATLAANVFGPTTGGKVYGAFFLAIALSSLTGFIANEFLVKSVGYAPMFYVSLGVTVFFGVCLLFYEEKKLRRKNQVSQF